MSYQDDEQSVQDSKPIELFEFTFANGQVTRYVGAPHDYTWFGSPYRAVVGGVRRGVLQVVSGVDNIPAFTVELPATDPVVQAYAGVGIPPQTLAVRCIRVQLRSGGSQQQWFGFVDSCSFRSGGNKRTAVFSVSSLIDRPLDVQIPKVVVSRLCNHVLYDSMCTIPRPFPSITVAITALSGVAMSVSGIGGSAIGAMPYGEVLHVASQERRSIVTQDSATGLNLSIDVAWPTTVHVGDTVTLFPGCDHTPETCRDTFANIVNFGGHTGLVSANFFWTDFRRSGKQ